MKTITKLYLKLFFLFGVTFGLITFGLDLWEEKEINFWGNLIVILFFAIMMTIINVSFTKSKYRKRGINKINDEHLKIHQNREFIANLSLGEISKRIREHDYFKKMKISQFENRLELNTEMTWESFGEKIIIEIQIIGENEYMYKVTSKPKLITTIMDFGKNFENVNKIQNLIQDVA